MPNLDAGNITYNLLKMTSGGIVLGPVLLGTNKAIHVLTTSTTTRRIINMATLAAADAQGETRVPEGLVESKIQCAIQQKKRRRKLKPLQLSKQINNRMISNPLA